MNHDSCWWLSSFGKTETTVADASTRWTHPGLLHKCFLYFFSIAVEKTWAAELPTNTATIDVVANSLGVDGLLSALVAGGSVYTVVDFFGCFDSYFGQFPFGTHGLVVEGNFHWFIITKSTLSVKNWR